MDVNGMEVAELADSAKIWQLYLEAFRLEPSVT